MKQRVGRMGAGDVDAFGAQLGNRRRNDVAVIATDGADLSSVGIEPCNDNTRMSDAKVAPQRGSNDA